MSSEYYVYKPHLAVTGFLAVLEDWPKETIQSVLDGAKLLSLWVMEDGAMCELISDIQTIVYLEGLGDDLICPSLSSDFDVDIKEAA